MITVIIPGEMRGKGRPRFTRQGGGRAFTDAKTVSAENWVRACAVEQAGTVPMDAALSVVITIEVDVPASWSQRKRESALANLIWPTSKPDLDNAVKLIADALNGIMWRDDKQIVRLTAAKRYAAVARTVLTVTEA